MSCKFELIAKKAVSMLSSQRPSQNISHYLRAICIFDDYIMTDNELQMDLAPYHLLKLKQFLNLRIDVPIVRYFVLRDSGHSHCSFLNLIKASNCVLTMMIITTPLRKFFFLFPLVRFIGGLILLDRNYNLFLQHFISLYSCLRIIQQTTA